MSRFMSPKLQRFKDEVRSIDRPHPCPGCGYDLRGLAAGRACPECGAAIAVRKGALPDPFFAGDQVDRDRWAFGLGLMLVAIVFAMTARLAFLVVGLAFVPPKIPAYYLGALLLNTLLWIVGVHLALPGSLAVHGCVSARMVRLARLGAWLFLPGLGVLLWVYIAQPSPRVELVARIASYALRGAAGMSVCLTAWILAEAALHAELDDAWRRLNNAAWLLPLPATIAAFFPPGIPWFALILLALALVPWVWLLIHYALGVRALRNHLRWAKRHAAERPGRDARIAATRAELDAQWQATIRPVEPDASPATHVPDRPCPHCGYNRRGLPLAARCPECGR